MEALALADPVMVEIHLTLSFKSKKYVKYTVLMIFSNVWFISHW